MNNFVGRYKYIFDTIDIRKVVGCFFIVRNDNNYPISSVTFASAFLHPNDDLTIKDLVNKDKAVYVNELETPKVYHKLLNTKKCFKEEVDRRFAAGNVKHLIASAVPNEPISAAINKAIFNYTLANIELNASKYNFNLANNKSYISMKETLAQYRKEFPSTNPFTTINP